MSISGGNLDIIHEVSQIGVSLIKIGISPNIELSNKCKASSVLGYFCTQEKVDLENIKTLIELGAYVNKEFKQGSNTFTPLSYFCTQETVNFEAIKLLIKNKADVNKPFYFNAQPDLEISD